MKSLPIALVVVAVATGFSITRAHADTIFSQTGAADGQYTSTVTEYWGQGFTVGGSNMALTTVDMLLGAQGAGAPGNAFFVDLYSDASGQPGTLLETLSGPNNPGSGTFTYTSTGTVLAANTSYWIVEGLSGSGTEFEYWNEENNTSPEVGTSIGAKFSFDSGANWSLQPSHSMQMVVNGIVVPEPSSFLLMLLGGSAALLMKRRRR